MHKYNMLYTIKLIEHVLTPESVIGNFVPITKNAPRGCALWSTMQMPQATAAGARMRQGTLLSLK